MNRLIYISCILSLICYCDSVNITQTGRTIIPSEDCGSCAIDGTTKIESNTNGILIGGSFVDTVLFGTFNITPSGIQDMFLLNINPITNTVEWVNTFGGTDSHSLAGFGMDGNAYILVASFFGTWTIGGTTFDSTDSNLVILKLNSTRDHVWSKMYGGLAADSPRDMAIDSNSNIIVVGSASGSQTSWGGENFTLSGSDVMIAKYDTNGNHLWSQSYGGSATDTLYSVATDSAGNIFALGSFYSATFDLNGTTVTNQGSQDILFIKFNSNGGIIWHKAFGTTASEDGSKVKVDSLGNVLITGTFSLSIDFGGGATFPSSNDAYLVKYDTNGSFVWQQIFGSSAYDSGLDIDVDPIDNSVFLSGQYRYNVSVSNVSLTNSTNIGAFGIRFNSSGSPIWAVSFPSDNGGAVDMVRISHVPNTDRTAILIHYADNFTDYNGVSVPKYGESGIMVAVVSENLPSPPPSPAASASPDASEHSSGSEDLPLVIIIPVAAGVLLLVVVAITAFLFKRRSDKIKRERYALEDAVL